MVVFLRAMIPQRTDSVKQRTVKKNIPMNASSLIIAQTPRLILREWRDSDLLPFAQLNADPRVMEYMLKPLSAPESDAFAQRIQEHIAAHGFGLWAVEEKESGNFLGYVGLSIPSFIVPTIGKPCVEIGWRLAHDAWGKGYATEAARAALDLAFNRYGLEEIVSFTVPANVRSTRVMEKLGMTHNPADDFDHPRIEKINPLCRHVLYRLAK